MSDLRERILIDLDKFNRTFNIADSLDLDDRETRVLDLAKRYREDAKYFLSKEDLPTSFGCITYAHGLLDALLIIKGKR
ncbi:DUF357 domain-containing protein [Candidatus Micrarchaeota archaeon]|nr:DUF357 domain-containing protein [Candidatus Micrarchaeota archaeon]